jgi:phage FluMu protein Com
MENPEIKALEHEKYICTECYQFGAHGDVTYGNWVEYAIRFAIVAPIIAIPSILYFMLLFGLFVLAKGKFIAVDTMDLFPLSKFLPEKPHTVKVCPHCKKVNTQAKIKDGNGQTALYFHKKNGLHLRHAKPQEKTTELVEPKPKHDPDEF